MRWRWRGNICGDFHACALIRTHLYFTFHLGFIQKKIPLGIRLSLTGTKNQEKDQVTPYSALATALAATIGTGNIVGISTAIAIGGPGAVFWCWLTGVFGIATCYAECYLSIRYRVRRADNTFAGGPMYILDRRLKKRKLAAAFAVFTLFASFGIGSSVQSYSIRTALQHQITVSPHLVGMAVGVLAGIIIIGGNSQIAKVCMWLVPLMSAFYVGGCLYYRKKQGGAAGDVSADSLIRRLPEGGGGRLHRRSAASWHPDRSLPGIVHQ